jgi:hypothetical protein
VVAGVGASDGGSVAAADMRRAWRRLSSDRVVSVVATDRMTVAATIAMTAHSGKCAATGEAGGGGGAGTSGAPGGTWVADAAGASPIAADRNAASPLRVVSVRGCVRCRVRRGAAVMVRVGGSFV